MKVHITQNKTEVKVRFADVVSLDETLAKIILPSLKRFRKSFIGSHYTEFADWHKQFDDGQLGDEKGDWSEKRFRAILDEIIWCFQRKLDNLTEPETLDEETQARLQKGFILFGKYFERLWI